MYPGLLQPGDIVGNSYRVESFLGKGGMGEVWLARHLRLARHVAIKVLRTHGDTLSEEALARFRKEAEIASRLQHPHIVTIHDYNFTAAGHPFMVMEFLEGESLGARLKRSGPLSLAETRTIIRQVCRALETTHKQGIVHRDLKPDNIFLTTQDGALWVKVLDFGISKILNVDSIQITQKQVVIGSPRYISPEQALGHSKNLTPQADIFSLGAVTYEMLSGKTAFEGDEVSSVLFRVVHQTPRSLAELLPELPEGVRQAIETAMEKRPGNRHASAMAFSEALDKDSLSPSEPPLAEEVVAEPEALKLPPPKCPWSLIVLIAALSLAIVGGALAYRHLYLQPIDLGQHKPPSESSSGSQTLWAKGGPPPEYWAKGGLPPPSPEHWAGPPLLPTEPSPKPPPEEGGGTPAPPRGRKPKPETKARAETKAKTTKAETRAEPPSGPNLPFVPEPASISAAEQRELAQAEQELKAKQYHAAENSIASKLNSLERNGPGWARAHAMRAEIACAQKDLQKYYAAMAWVPTAWRPGVRNACKHLDFEPP